MADTTTGLQQTLHDRYRIERELGQGGMATVYLAHDVRHNRQVALKLLRPELAAIIGAERFLKEIETTANLQHPYILPLCRQRGHEPVGRRCRLRRVGERDPGLPAGWLLRR